jgi:hypothetical protein
VRGGTPPCFASRPPHRSSWRLATRGPGRGRRRPPQAWTQLLGQHLHDGPAAAVLGGPAPLLEPAHDHDPAALREGLRGVLGLVAPHVGVGLRRGAGLSAGPFPQPALRTGRARLHASGSPRVHATEQWCSLVWIPSTRASACSGVGHGASVFTGGLLAFQDLRCELAAALRHAPPLLGRVAGFPGLGLLRRLRPTQAPTVDSGPARPQPGRPAGRAAPGRFPRSCCDRLTGEVASCAPAASPRVRRRLSPWPPGRRYRPASESPAVAGVRRSPAHTHQVGAGSSLEGLYSAGSSRPPSRLACGPGPSGSADPSRRCRGCSHPPLHFQGRAAPSFTSLLRQAGGRALASLPDRITPRGARPR